MALVMLGALIALGAASFVAINNRYRAVYQTASWQEALHTAEAGLDLGLTEIRRELWDQANQWSGWTDVNGNQIKWTDASGTALSSSGAKAILSGTPRGAIRTQGVILRSASAEGGSSSIAYVTVDAPPELVDSTGSQWYRIRATGVCGIPGNRVIAGDKEDANLRKLDIQYDHTRTTAVAVSAPQAQRTVEAIVRPVGAFERALEGFSIDMTDQNIVVDSWDSRNKTKYPNGAYPINNPTDPNTGRQWNGNIAATGQVINAGNAHIYGTASTNNGSVLNGNNVTGNDMNYSGGYMNNPDRIRNDFYDEMIPITAPSVAATTGTPTSIMSSYTATASTGTPTQLNLTAINMSGSDTLTLAAPRDASGHILRDANGNPVPSYVQLVVSGNFSMTGNSSIVTEPGVMVRIFISGDTDVGGNGFANVSADGLSNYNTPRNMQLYGVDRPRNADGTVNTGSIKIAGNGGFSGTVYAPNYDVTLKGGGNADTVFGAFVGNSITMTGVQSVHYDEALGTAGLITGYKLASWFEDSR